MKDDRDGDGDGQQPWRVALNGRLGAGQQRPSQKRRRGRGRGSRGAARALRARSAGHPAGRCLACRRTCGGTACAPPTPGRGTAAGPGTGPLGDPHGEVPVFWPRLLVSLTKSQLLRFAPKSPGPGRRPTVPALSLPVPAPPPRHRAATLVLAGASCGGATARGATTVSAIHDWRVTGELATTVGARRPFAGLSRKKLPPHGLQKKLPAATFGERAPATPSFVSTALDLEECKRTTLGLWSEISGGIGTELCTEIWRCTEVRRFGLPQLLVASTVRVSQAAKPSLGCKPSEMPFLHNSPSAAHPVGLGLHCTYNVCHNSHTQKRSLQLLPPWGGGPSR